MATRSTIMDTNSFRPEMAQALDKPTQDMISRRQTLLGGSYRLFYRHPVHLVRGEGQYMWDAQGNKYLDVYNNVASIGHCHPAVTEAVHAQARQLNTHSRYLHERILDYTESLLTTLPDALGNAMYMCTGSEANDLAMRIAHAYSGGTGIIVTQEAYHGTSYLTSGASPALGSGQAIARDVRLVPAPDAYRIDTPDMGIWLANQIQMQIDDLARCGIKFAGFMADSLFSSDGVLPGHRGLLQAAIDTVHRNGGIFIADEVQPGFARTGEAFWGFARHGIVPDVVTLGKPMGNGIPVAGLVARPEVLSAFSDAVPYFNTFGGNPVSMAAAQAVLQVIKQERLQEHSAKVGQRLLYELQRLQHDHEVIGDVRGAGLYIGFELVTDRESKSPARELALDVIEHLRQQRVLTSVAGPHGNILKLRPPLAFQESDIDWLVGALDTALHALPSAR